MKDFKHVIHFKSKCGSHREMFVSDVTLAVPRQGEWFFDENNKQWLVESVSWRYEEEKRGDSDYLGFSLNVMQETTVLLSEV